MIAFSYFNLFVLVINNIIGGGGHFFYPPFGIAKTSSVNH